MEFLSWLKVGGVTYRIVAAAADENTDLASASHWAQTDYRKRVITLRADIAERPQQVRDTLIHELLHCLLHFTALDSEWPDGSRELWVEQLSNVLVMAFNDNPSLPKMFLESLEDV